MSNIVTVETLLASLAGTEPTRLIVRLRGTLINVFWHGDGKPVGWAINTTPIDEAAMRNVLEDLQFGARIR
jgi:hypothetical protein